MSVAVAAPGSRPRRAKISGPRGQRASDRQRTGSGSRRQNERSCARQERQHKNCGENVWDSTLDLGREGRAQSNVDVDANADADAGADASADSDSDSDSLGCGWRRSRRSSRQTLENPDSRWKWTRAKTPARESG